MDPEARWLVAAGIALVSAVLAIEPFVASEAPMSLSPEHAPPVASHRYVGYEIDAYTPDECSDCRVGRMGWPPFVSRRAGPIGVEIGPSSFVSPTDAPTSTFFLYEDDVSYGEMRRLLLYQGTIPPPYRVRTEELVNHFYYDYAEPGGAAPLAVTTEVGPTPWHPEHRLVHVGLQSSIHAVSLDVRIEIEFDPSRVRTYRLLGYETLALFDESYGRDPEGVERVVAGHSATALYEIVRVDATDDPVATLELRYRVPGARESTIVSYAVRDDGDALAGTSVDFRFSAAVATFAKQLRGELPEIAYRDVLALASEAVGRDRHCERHEFLELVHRAGRIAREQLPSLVACPAIALTRAWAHG